MVKRKKYDLRGNELEEGSTLLWNYEENDKLYENFLDMVAGIDDKVKIIVNDNVLEALKESWNHVGLWFEKPGILRIDDDNTLLKDNPYEGKAVRLDKLVLREAEGLQDREIKKWIKVFEKCISKFEKVMKRRNNE